MTQMKIAEENNLFLNDTYISQLGKWKKQNVGNYCQET